MSQDDLAHSDKTLLWETAVELKNLIKRIDQHSADRKNELETIHRKIDELRDGRVKDRESLLDIIRQVELQAIKENHKLNIKIAALTGSIGIVSGGIGSFLFQLMKGSP